MTTTGRVLGAVLVFVAAGLAVGATFLPLYEMRWLFNDGPLVSYIPNSWEFMDPKPQPMNAAEHTTRYGVPICAAAVLLVLSAVLTFRRFRVGPPGALAGAALLTGAVWAVGMDYSARTSGRGTVEGLVTTVTMGEGLWMLFVATAVAVVGALLMQQLPPSAPRPETPDAVVIHQIDTEDETDTPAYGIPVQLP